MTDYYVSPSGNNSNNGLSPATPWLTLAHAQANTSTNDRIFHLSGGVWNDQRYDFSTARQLGSYNGASRWVLDYDGSNGGDYFHLVGLAGTSTIADCEIRNNFSGSNATNAGRGISYSGSNTVVTNCYVHDIGGTPILRNFGGDNTVVEDSIIELYEQAWYTYGGIWGGGISHAGSGDPPNGNIVRRCQCFEGVGEGISAYSGSGSTPATDILFEDNDLYGCRAAGLYLNGCHDSIVRRNVITGSTDTDLHRSGGYTGYALLQSTEADFPGDFNNDYGSDNNHWYLNLAAFTAFGIKMAAWWAQNQATTNCIVEHNTFISNEFNVGTEHSFSSNTFRQNASILIGSEGAGAAPAHTDGSGSGFTKSQNFWEGGGEGASWNDASDFSDSAWLPFKTSGWQSLASSSAVTIEDWRPTTQVLGTQLTNPDTAANYTDYEGTADFREAGALAETADEPPDPPDPPPPTGQEIRVERHTVTFGASADSTAVTFDMAAKNDTSVLPRLTSVRFGSGGPSAGTGVQQTIATLGVTVESVTASGCTLVRDSGGSDVDVRCELEVWFYDGATGGANEFIVRHSETHTLANADTADTLTVSGASDDADLVAFVTGIRSATAGGFAHFVRARIDGGGDVVLERENGTGATVVSVMAVEFTGSNWLVQQVAHTTSAWNADQTETLGTAVTWANSFVISSALIADDEPDETTYNCWSGTGGASVRFRQDSDSGAGSNFAEINAFVVQNAEMTVTHLASTVAAGSNPNSYSVAVSPVLSDLAAAGSIVTATDNISAYNDDPANWLNYYLIDTDELTLWRSRSSDGALTFKAQVIDFSAMTTEAAAGGGVPSGLLLLNCG